MNEKVRILCCLQRETSFYVVFFVCFMLLSFCNVRFKKYFIKIKYICIEIETFILFFFILKIFFLRFSGKKFGLHEVRPKDFSVGPEFFLTVKLNHPHSHIHFASGRNSDLPKVRKVNSFREINY